MRAHVRTGVCHGTMDVSRHHLGKFACCHVHHATMPPCHASKRAATACRWMPLASGRLGLLCWNQSSLFLMAVGLWDRQGRMISDLIS